MDEPRKQEREIHFSCEMSYYNSVYSYWQEAWLQQKPSWLDRENPAWEGNSKVHYWEPAWQSVILDDYLPRILEAGFDGV